MRFTADRMLGKLAKKLRLLGIDTEYFRSIDEESILEFCRKEGRILLTRDRGLYEKALKNGIDVFLLKSDDWKSQLRAIDDKFGIHSKPYTRCSICNTLLVKVEKEFVKDKIPEYVYLTQDEFYECPKCRRIYWRGTHVEHMEKELRRVLKR